MTRSSWLVPFAALGMATLCGCGDSLDVAEVEGIVQMDGKPLDRIQVEFWPVGPGVRSIGTTDSSGHFKLTTDDGTRDGAVVGSHKVVLHDVWVLGDKFLGRAGEDADMSQGRKPRISGMYSNPEKTSLTAEVVSGQKNEVTLDVSAAGAEPASMSRDR